jgi:hypothetical protein
MLTEMILAHVVTVTVAGAPTAAPTTSYVPPADEDVSLAMQPPGAWGPRMGNWSLTLGGSGYSGRSFGSATLGFNGAIGHFLTDVLELSLRQSLDFTDVGGSNLLASTAVGLDFHFPGDQWWPYIGAQFGYLYGDQSDTWMIGPEAGLKWFVKPETYLFGQVEYQHFFDRLRAPDETSRRGQWVFKLGVGFLW